MFLIVGSNPIPWFDLSRLFNSADKFSSIAFNLAVKVFSNLKISSLKNPSPSNLKKKGTCLFCGSIVSSEFLAISTEDFILFNNSNSAFID